MRTVLVDAEPDPIAIDPRRTAVVVIDMQRDFLEPGGFGESLGNDVSLLHAAVGAVPRAARGRAADGHARHPHARGPSARSVRRARGPRSSAARPRVRIGAPGPMGRILIRGEPGHDIIPELAPLAGEPVIDKPGKGAFYATDLQAILLAARGIDTLIVCGVTTEVCVHTTVREANDRGYRCIVLGDCCGSYFPEFHEAGLAMIKAQGGIFGWVSDSRRVLSALRRDRARVRHDRSRERRDDRATTRAVDARRLERVLRLRHEHPRQPARADRPAALRAQDAGRPRVRPHPARRPG